MAQQTGPSKSQLLEALRDSEREVLAKLGAIPQSEFEKGAYENGWNRREILAHVASIEWTYARLIGLAGGESAPAAPSQPRTSAPLSGGISDYNQRQVDKLANAPVPELLELFQKNRAATIEAVEGAEEGLFAVPVRSAGGISGSLGTVLHLVAVQHVLAHVRDIEGA